MTEEKLTLKVQGEFEIDVVVTQDRWKDSSSFTFVDIPSTVRFSKGTIQELREQAVLEFKMNRMEEQCEQE